MNELKLHDGTPVTQKTIDIMEAITVALLDHLASVQDEQSVIQTIADDAEATYEEVEDFLYGTDSERVKA